MIITVDVIITDGVRMPDYPSGYTVIEDLGDKMVIEAKDRDINAITITALGGSTV